MTSGNEKGGQQGGARPARAAGLQPIKAVRGTRDLLPDQTPLWNRVEATARALFARYGFGEIRTPVIEATELFARGVGEETDIVSKEMFTWEDRARAASEKAQSLTLRPESTAGVVRAYIEHKLGETGSLQKLYYIGPQFRRERPQRGRYRQFWQIGAEVIGPQSSGSESPLRDAEVLEMLASLLDELGVRGWRLELNSVGNAEDRARYNSALRQALEPVKARLCPDNQRRAETNPLRVLDSKDEQDQEIINSLPKIAEFLSDESKQHFAQVLAALDTCGVPYHVNPRLVRGLDYYTRTTFEFTVQTGLGTQNALLGGGRYDGLSEMLGGPKAPGIGFAIGEDRLILVLRSRRSRMRRPQGCSLASRRWMRTSRRWAWSGTLPRWHLRGSCGETGWRSRWVMDRSSCARALRWRTGWRARLCCSGRMSLRRMRPR